MNYDKAKAVVLRHIDLTSAAVMSAEDDLNRPAEYRTEHILTLIYIMKRNICDALYALEYHEERERLAERDKKVADMEGEE